MMTSIVVEMQCKVMMECSDFVLSELRFLNFCPQEPTK